MQLMRAVAIRHCHHISILPWPISRSKLTIQKPIIQWRKCSRSEGSSLSIVSPPFSVMSNPDANGELDGGFCCDCDCGRGSGCCCDCCCCSRAGGGVPALSSSTRLGSELEKPKRLPKIDDDCFLSDDNRVPSPMSAS